MDPSILMVTEHSTRYSRTKPARKNVFLTRHQKKKPKHGKIYSNIPKGPRIQLLKEEERLTDKILTHGTLAPPQTPSFPNFTRLPPELQQMIWSFALSAVLPLIEVYRDPQTGTLHASSPASQILSVCGPSQKHVSTLTMTSRLNPDTLTPPAPSNILIRPSIDTLYLPSLHHLNITHFLLHPSSKCIRHLATTLKSALPLSTPNAHFFSINRLIHSLPSLRTITILDGWMAGDEDRLDRSRYKKGFDHHFELVEIPSFWAESNWRSNWCCGDVEEIRASYEGWAGEFRKDGRGRELPEIIGRRLLRTFIWSDAATRPETEIEEWRGIGAVDDDRIKINDIFG